MDPLTILAVVVAILLISFAVAHTFFDLEGRISRLFRRGPKGK